MRHSSWKMNSAWLRVLTKTSVVVCRLDQRRRSRRARGAPSDRPRAAASRRRSMVTSGAAPASAPMRSAARRLRRRAAAPDKRQRSSGSATVAERPTLASVRAPARTAAPGRATSRSPRFDGHERMQLVEHDAPSEPNRYGASAVGEQERELLGRGQQDVRRIAALALALRARRVAGARLDADRQPHLGDRRSRLRAMSTASAFSGEM